MNKKLPLLRLDNFCCIREGISLFSPLNLTLNEGEALHLRAANAVGKTTLLRALYGLAIETIGHIFWQNNPVNCLLDKANYLKDVAGSLSGLTVAEALTKMLIFSGQPTQPECLQKALQQTGLNNSQLLSELLSKGQKKRLHIARLLIVKRPLWLLDEPFDGLDQQGINMLQQIMEEHLNQAGIIIYTSHTHNTSSLCLSDKQIQLQPNPQRLFT